MQLSMDCVVVCGSSSSKRTPMDQVFISCVGNGTVLIISLRKRKNLKPIDLLTVNLALCDLTVCLIGYPLPVVSGFANRWSFGDAGCTWYGFCGFFFPLNSMMTQMAMSICRYLKLCRKQFDDRLLGELMPKIIVSLWVYTLLWTIPPLIGWNSYVPERFKSSCTVDWASQDRVDRSYIICIFVFCYLVPLAGLLGSYIAIARKILNHRSLILKQHTSHFTHFWTEVRLIKSSLAVTVAFTIAWTPYAVVSFLAMVMDVSYIPHSVYAIPTFMAKSAACYNPVIYVMFNKKFKEELQRLCCCCGCMCCKVSINISTHKNIAKFGEVGCVTWTNPFSRQFVHLPHSPAMGDQRRLFVSSKKNSQSLEPRHPLGMVIHETNCDPMMFIAEEDVPGPSTGNTVVHPFSKPTCSTALPLVNLPHVPVPYLEATIQEFTPTSRQCESEDGSSRRISVAVVYAESQM
ncbi:opsin-5-like isoform X2 [Asterias amurensis]|uniref:opsin-5-like isoform X2 n=1 Tax=Asterias amurensis TaxID=7602 RepID=UPI003AB71BAD